MRASKSLTWQICATLMMFCIAVGIVFTHDLALRGDAEAISYVGDHPLIDDAMFLRKYWVLSDWWRVLFVPIVGVVILVWLPGFRKTAHICVVLAAVSMMWFLCFVPSVYWAINSGVLSVVADSQEATIRNIESLEDRTRELEGEENSPAPTVDGKEK